MRGRAQRRVIVLLGPDGSGKSTLATAINQAQTDAAVLQFRGKILDRLRGRTDYRDASTDPKAVRALAPAPALFKALFIWVDLWVTWLLHAHRGQTVLWERYVYDLVAHPERLGVQSAPGFIRRGLCWSYPRPDVILLAEAEASAIAQRKGELVEAEIEEIYRRFELLLSSRRLRSLVHRVDCNQDPAAAVGDTMAVLRNGFGS